MAEVVGSQVSQGPEEVVVNIHTGVLQPAGKEGLETALPLSQHSQQEGAPTTQPTTAAAVPPAGLVGSQEDVAQLPVGSQHTVGGEAVACPEDIPPELASQVAASQAASTHVGGTAPDGGKAEEEEDTAS